MSFVGAAPKWKCPDQDAIAGRAGNPIGLEGTLELTAFKSESLFSLTRFADSLLLFLLQCLQCIFCQHIAIEYKEGNYLITVFM